MPSIFIVILFLLVAHASLAAETLLFDDFQDGAAEGWQAFGDGVIEVSTYEWNASLHMTNNSAVVRAVPIGRPAQLLVGGTFAALDLEKGKACVLETTIDEGNTWIEVLRVGHDQDDGLTLHPGSQSLEAGRDVSRLWLRARVDGNRADDSCWLDNVYVIGSGKAAAPGGPRALSADILLGETAMKEPVGMHEFAPTGEVNESAATFSGRLTLAESSGTWETVLDAWDRRGKVGAAIQRLPEFDFDFFQRGEDLVPLKRGLLRREHLYWEIILQPGRVWKEAGDSGWSRAALPFALQERAANCVHNGVMTWLFNGDGDVSRVAWQMSSETCGYLKFNLAGIADAEYTKEDLTVAAQEQVDRLDAHRAARLPVRPLEELSNRYPDVETLGVAVKDGIPPGDLSVFGFVVDGVHYRSDCPTRHGPYPFCDSLPLPSYSTAKSMVAGLATMRLEKLAPGSSQKAIAELIPECDSKRWRDVTVEHALDMATGNFRSTDHEIDEHSDASRDFIFGDSHSEKLEFACGHFKRKAKPGEQFVYHTSDTYLVGTALQAQLRGRKGPGADLYRDILVNPIWSSLQLSPLLDDSLRTYDEHAQPFAGWGLTYEADDVVRIAQWLQDGAKIDGEPALDTTMLAASLQRDPGDRGLRAVIDDQRYNNGFWAYRSGPTVGCMADAWTPVMSGVSGISIVMFPNDVIYYYFSDSYVFRWQSARDVAHRIRELCQ